MDLSERQRQIIDIVKENEPINGDSIADQLGLTRSTLRSDLAVLTMTGILDARPKVGYFYSGLNTDPLVQDRLLHTKVGDIMIPAVIVKQDTSIQEAVANLFMYDAGSLYVVDPKNDLVGIASRKDLLRAVVSGNYAEVPIAVMMTRMPNIHVTYPEVSVLEAGKMIRQYEVDSLPVLKSATSKEVIGKLSKTNLAYLLVELGEGVE